MTLDELTKHATEVANMTFAKKEDKEKLRKSIIDLIAVSCYEYGNNEQFKTEMNDYLRWRKNNTALRG